MLSDLTERLSTAIITVPSSIFTEQNILSNLFIVQKNVKGGNSSNCMVLIFSDTISKRNNRQLYLLTCRKCYLLLVGLSDTYLHEYKQYLIPQ